MDVYFAGMLVSFTGQTKTLENTPRYVSVLAASSMYNVHVHVHVCE